MFERGADLLRKPVFPQEAFNVARTRLGTEATTNSPSDPGNLLQLVGRLVYPEGHAYRLPVQVAGVGANAIQLSQLTEFARMHITPDQTVVVAVGDITMSRLQKLTRNVFADWKGKAVEQAPPPPSIDRLPTGPAISLVDHSMLTQSQILIAAPGTPAFADDFEALEVLNETLAGAPLTSRINSVLRESLGYTYQAMSSLDVRRGPGLFLLKQNVAKESTVESLRTIFSQIDRLRSEDVPEEELAIFKARLRSSVLLGYDSSWATLEELITIATLGLPADYASQRLARIRAVTSAQVRAAATKYLATDRLRTVIVGDVATIRKPLEDAGLGEVHTVESASASPHVQVRAHR
jgi:zinc protease